MKDVMDMMEENRDGAMEFPRDLMIEDCFSEGAEPLYGFVTNITIPEEMLEPCIVDEECFENGTRFDELNDDMNEISDDVEDDLNPSELNPNHRFIRSTTEKGSQ